MTLKINFRLVPDPILRTPAAAFTVAELFSTDARKLARDLERALAQPVGALRAVGVAAPQIGVAKRLCLISDVKRGLPSVAMFNPTCEVVRNDEPTTVPEACLSIPDTVGIVTRPSHVRVDFFDVTGKARRMELAGYWASLVQHEIDHLDGVLFTDRVDVDARGRPCLWSLGEFERDASKFVVRNAAGWARLNKRMFLLDESADDE